MRPTFSQFIFQIIQCRVQWRRLQLHPAKGVVPKAEQADAVGEAKDTHCTFFGGSDSDWLRVADSNSAHSGAAAWSGSS